MSAETRRELHSRWLAHDDRPDHLLWLPLGRWRVACCARCFGLHLALLIALLLQLIWHLPAQSANALEYALLVLMTTPALLDWSAGRLGWAGKPVLRPLTGALLGLALGRQLAFYWQNPSHELFWLQLLGLGLGVTATELVRLSGIGEMLE